MTDALIIRQVEIAGRAGLDVLLCEGRIGAIDTRLDQPGTEIDGRGCELLPGLIDHHLHLLSWSAQMESVDLKQAADGAQLYEALRNAPARNGWIRATGYHESVAGILSRRELDAIRSDVKVRVQHKGGALWMFNSNGLETLGSDLAMPEGAERDGDGSLNGRFWRADAWLRHRTPPLLQSLTSISSALARWGVTGVTDATVTNDADSARLIADQVRDGAMRQRVMLMGGLELPQSSHYVVGPLKVMLDDRALPDIEDLVQTIIGARIRGRAVAMHCVTLAELSVALASFAQAGPHDGDRIEHGGEITPSHAAEIAGLGLTVVTQPGFLFEKGDRYLRECEDPDILYPCASLRRRGIKVAASSDAPYGGADPWLAMRSAATRRTRNGAVINADERVDASECIGLYFGGFHDPGGPPRRIKLGAIADLCLVRTAARETLASDLVAATIVGGEVVYEGGG